MNCHSFVTHRTESSASMSSSTPKNRMRAAPPRRSAKCPRKNPPKALTTNRTDSAPKIAPEVQPVSSLIASTNTGIAQNVVAPFMNTQRNPMSTITQP